MDTRRWRGRDTLLVLVLLPVLILILPVLLGWLAVGERLARCPACGRRGGLHDVTPLLTHAPEGWRLRRSRMVRTRELACHHCGAHFLEPPGEPLHRVDSAV